ncbi:hypothetical protein BLD25_02800 [Candidatus Gracilibacteria bacterium GN02-872]|nr:hypothetical protein BLD25_02800 [Candidatus Gracilibacteria bacterium GN02-872]
MTEHIKKINIKIKEYYEYIKLSGKNQDNFNFENFIQEINLLFDEVSKDKDNHSNNEKTFEELFKTSESDLIYRLKKNIKEIENGVNEIKNNFKNKKEIFLDFDFFGENRLLTLTLNDFDKNCEGYLGGYYILALKALLVLWKNEINLLDESMSFHHIEKSKLDIKKIQKILKDQVENQNNQEDGKKILMEVLEYSEFLCFKFNILNEDCLNSGYSNTYENYLDIIKFINNISKPKEENDNSINDISKIKEEDINNELDLFKIFLYYKDNKYKDKFEKSYKKLKSILEKFNSYKKNQNITFFINNLISLLNKIAENGNEKFDYYIEIDLINNFIDENDIKQTYFTYYKFAQLYKNLGKLKKQDLHFRTAEDNINLAIKKFEEQNGAYFPFIATSDIFSETSIFSYSTFIIPTKTDYYLKVKQEQIKILEEKSELKLNTMISDINNKILSNEEILSEKLHDNNIKTIEILAIFSAIILFTSSSIQIYQYLTDTNSAIIFLLTFSLSLIGFIGIIIFLFSKNISTKKYIIFLIIFISLFLLIYFKKDNSNLYNNYYKEIIKEEILKDLEQIKNILN